jgi:hypothetical protein
LLLSLLLSPNTKHGVDVLDPKLLLSLSKAKHLLTEARDPLAEACRLLLCSEACLNTSQTKVRALQAKITGRLSALHTHLTGLSAHLSSGLGTSHAQLSAL